LKRQGDALTFQLTNDLRVDIPEIKPGRREIRVLVRILFFCFAGLGENFAWVRQQHPPTLSLAR
jgi:hypothetical protein